MLILNTNMMLVIYTAFMAVILLLVLFIVAGKALDSKKAPKAAVATDPEENISQAGKAAIAMALHLYYGVHDHESDVITFKNIYNRYSPWSSKIYGIQ